MLSVLKTTLLIVLLVFIVPVLAHAAWWMTQDHPRSWSSADWSSSGLLPPARSDPDASIRVMAARTGGLKGIVAVHTWLVLKPAGAANYERYDVVGWGTPLRRNSQPPDGRWYSNEPAVIHEVRGTAAERLMPQVQAAIRDYQWAQRGAYRTWPGPNSNTFVAAIVAAVPGLQADIPPTAIGRDFPPGPWVRRGPLGGIVATLGGLASVTLGRREGVQVSLLGLVAGIRFHHPTLILPGFGALGDRL